jgi:DNA polymerase
MTSAQKSELFAFLTTAEGWISGYRVTIPCPSFTDSPEPTAGFESLDAVANSVRACTACRLCETRKNAVPGEGPADLSAVTVMVIGEGPGADEDESGRPFVGKAGQLLDKMLGSIGLSRTTNCFIANIVKCRPPQNREPAPDETQACIRFLRDQIELVRPAMILAVGRTAAQNLLGTTDGINKLRGRFFDYGGIPLLPTFHPSALLRDETLKRPAWEDLKLFRAELDRITGPQA